MRALAFKVRCPGIVTVTSSDRPSAEAGETGGMKTQPDPHFRHRFPAEIISHAVWLYDVFSLSVRDVELILAERGVVVSYETLRRWCKKFGASFADRLRRRRPRPGDKWHMDEVFIRIQGVQCQAGSKIDPLSASNFDSFRCGLCRSSKGGPAHRGEPLKRPMQRRAGEPVDPAAQAHALASGACWLCHPEGKGQLVKVGAH